MIQEGILIKIRLGYFKNKYLIEFSLKDVIIKIKFLDPNFSLKINNILFSDIYLKKIRNKIFKSKF